MDTFIPQREPYRMENTGYAQHATRSLNRMSPLPAMHNMWGVDGSPWIRMGFGANNVGRSLVPAQPPAQELLEARMPLTAAAAVEEELHRQGHPALNRRAISLAAKTETSQGEEALEEVAAAFKNRDVNAFQQAILKFTSLDETAGDGATGARLAGQGLGKVLGPLIAEDRGAAREFLEKALPQSAQTAGMSLTAGIKARLAEKVAMDEKRQKQQDLLQDHLERRRTGDMMYMEQWMGPDVKTYSVIQMPSGHDGWEKSGVMSQIVFPGYGFGAHQMVAQYADTDLNQGLNDLKDQGVDVQHWAERFVKNSIDA